MDFLAKGANWSVIVGLTWKVALFLVLSAIINKTIQFFGIQRRFWKLLGNCPGETEFHWLYGHLHKLPYGEDFLKYIQDKVNRFPKLFVMWRGPFNPAVFVYHPETMKIILKSTEPKPRGIGGPYEQLIPWLGEGILVSSGKRWARTRRLLTPAFHFDMLKSYTNVFNEAAEVLLEKIDKFAESGESFELFEHISMCTLDIILRCAFSYNTDLQKKGKQHPYLQAINEITQLLTVRSRKPYLNPDFIYFLTANGKRFLKHCNYAHSVTEEIIRTRREILENEDVTEREKLDFLDILLTAKDSDGVGLSDIDIRNEVDTFLFEGHDTTASGTSWIMYSLAKHQEHQRQVQNELDDLFNSKDSPTERIDWKDLTKLEHLALCVKEGMRIHSPVPGVARKLEHDVVMDGKTIPRGTQINISLYGLHHNPEVWENHTEFRPERFEQDKMKDIDPFAFVPFAAGPRNCIGQHFALNEEKVLISRILRRFNIELDPTKKCVHHPQAVMRAKDGIWVTAKTRAVSS